MVKQEREMNERIKELVKQAADYANTYSDAGADVWFEIYNKKFAELIVRECARLNLELSYELAGVIVDTEEGIGFDSVCLNTVKQVHNSLASRQLTEHFGVEEWATFGLTLDLAPATFSGQEIGGLHSVWIHISLSILLPSGLKFIAYLENIYERTN